MNALKAEAKRTYLGVADLAPGYMLSTEFSSTGGSTSETSTEYRGGEQIMTKRVRVDHDEIQKGAQNILNRAYLLMRTHCAPAFGAMYFVSEEAFPALDKELDELRDAASVLNLDCLARGSARETRVEVFPFDVDPRNTRVALRIGRTLFEYLTRLRNSYTGTEKNAFTMEWRLSKNLADMVVGHQHDVVRAALLASESQRPIMIGNYGGRRGVAREVGKTVMLDYKPIDAAIALFAPAAKAFT